MSVANPCNYKEWHLGCTTLCRDISDDSTELPLKEQFCIQLCALLGAECYTYLVIDNGFKTETVKVGCSAGSPYIIERGVDSTRPRTWFAGDNISWMMTAQAVKDCVACAKSEEEPDETPLIKSDSLDITQNDDGQWCIESADVADGDCSWSDCGYRYSWEGGVIKKEALPATEVLRDGVYSNATIVVENGCIKAVTKGCPLVVSSCPEDCCDACDDKQDGV